MKKIFACLLVALVTAGALNANAQSAGNFGIGFRLGDPSGLSLKKYLGNKAIEFNIGRTRMWYNKGWYETRFDGPFLERRFGYKDVKFNAYRATVPLSMQVHVLFHNNLKKINSEENSGLDWYYGLGPQVRIQSFYVDYWYKVPGDNDWVIARDERFTDLDVGLDGVLGLEYRFQQAPLSLFADVTLFMEVADDPFLFWPQGGVGVRYNF